MQYMGLLNIRLRVFVYTHIDTWSLEVLYAISSLDVVRELIPKVW